VNYSLEPRWRPEWITVLAGEDRCHLNALAMRDGRPRYVTALVQTDTAHGWREKKGVAGLLVDIDDNAVITSGLAMPHSPRWHDGTIWFVESGKGALSRVDMATGTVTTVATLPGFTRGLAFIGLYALIGLSQVRESVFSELPVTETTVERNCGVWIVDTRTDETAGFVKFEGVVQEIFDLQVLPGMKWPTFIQEPSTLTTPAFVLSDTALTQVARSSTSMSCAHGELIATFNRADPSLTMNRDPLRTSEILFLLSLKDADPTDITMAGINRMPSMLHMRRIATSIHRYRFLTRNRSSKIKWFRLPPPGAAFTGGACFCLVEPSQFRLIGRGSE